MAVGGGSWRIKWNRCTSCRHSLAPPYYVPLLNKKKLLKKSRNKSKNGGKRLDGALTHRAHTHIHSGRIFKWDVGQWREILRKEGKKTKELDAMIPRPNSGWMTLAFASRSSEMDETGDFSGLVWLLFFFLIPPPLSWYFEFFASCFIRSLHSFYASMISFSIRNSIPHIFERIKKASCWGAGRVIETPTNSRRPAAGSPTRASFSPFPMCVYIPLEQCCGFYFCLRFYMLLPSDEMMDPFLSARDMYIENSQATFVSTCDFRLLLLSLYIPPHLTIDSFRVYSGCLVLYRYGVNESAESSDCHHNNIGRERYTVYGRCIYSKGNRTFDSNIPTQRTALVMYRLAGWHVRI